MELAPNDRIILCQPDKMKGCSLCCGLFNFSNISSMSLSGFLEDGAERVKKLENYSEFNVSSRIRDEFSHICPYQGFLGSGKPGCLIHPLSSGFEGRGRSLFASKICSEFFCPAHAILTEDEKKFLIENVSDWHLYSVAVADPESYSFIYSYIRENFAEDGNPHLIRGLVDAGLTAHSENLAEHQGAIFSYSVPEYNIIKKNFCIRYIDEKRDRMVSLIVKTAAGFRF